MHDTSRVVEKMTGESKKDGKKEENYQIAKKKIFLENLVLMRNVRLQGTIK